MRELKMKLERAIERVARMEAIVARQVTLVAFLKEAGHDSREAEQVLYTFLRSWDLAADYEALIRTEMDEAAELKREILERR